MKVWSCFIMALLLSAACGGAESPHEGTASHLDAAAESDVSDVQLIDATGTTQRDSAPLDPTPARDAIADAGLDERLTDADGSDADARCVQLVNIASPIDETTSTEPEPVAAGGTIVDGTYIATRAINYGAPDGGYNATNFRETVLIQNGLMHLVRDLPGPILSHVVVSATYAVSNTTLFLEYVCPAPPPGTELTQTSQYTSAIVDGGQIELTIYDGQSPKELVVFSRR